MNGGKRLQQQLGSSTYKKRLLNLPRPAPFFIALLPRQKKASACLTLRCLWWANAYAAVRLYGILAWRGGGEKERPSIYFLPASKKEGGRPIKKGCPSLPTRPCQQTIINLLRSRRQPPLGEGGTKATKNSPLTDKQTSISIHPPRKNRGKKGKV